MLVKELCNLPGPSAFEDAVRDFIRERVSADEIYIDDASLIKTGTSVNLLSNPGFEEDATTNINNEILLHVYLMCLPYQIHFGN